MSVLVFSVNPVQDLNIFSLDYMNETALRYLNQLCKLKSPVKAYKALPSFHLRLMWLPGAAAGILWSIGNIGAIVAVERLGQGVG